MGDRTVYNTNNPRLSVFMSRFRELVEEHGGVTEVVKKTGISRPTILFWVNGQRVPDGFNLMALCKALGCSADYLLGLSGTKSLDATEQAASAYTGLSGAAITQVKKMDVERLDMLNRMLASERFPLFLMMLAEIRENAGQVRDNINRINNLDRLVPQIGGEFDRSRAVMSENYRLYGVLSYFTESANRLASDVCDVDLAKAYLRRELENEVERDDNGQ